MVIGIPLPSKMMKMWGIFVITMSLLSAIAAEISFTCDFERDTCGFTNQEGLTTLWERREMKLGGKEGYMMVVEANDTSPQLSKMITPYFDDIGENIPACLSFDLYVSHVKNFAVQQEREFGITSVWVKATNQKDGWQKPRFDVEIDESTRFFFEAVMDSSETNSLAALDNMKLELKKC